MRFLVDAQLLLRLARLLARAGHDTHLNVIVEAFEEGDFVEIGPHALIVHRRRED